MTLVPSDAHSLPPVIAAMVRPATAGGVLAFAALAVLGTAFAFQYVWGYQPCPLCHWQRWPWAGAIVLGLAALAAGTAGRPDLARGVLALAGAVLLGGAGLAGYHVGVEAGWWQGTAACGGAIYGTGLSTEELRQRLLTQEVVRCDEVQWRFAGLSMAGWNGLLSLGGAVAALWVAAVPVRAGEKRAGKEEAST